ncbi:zona pellucida sperm-binding protein 1 [Pipistrellus kuhlii]|uniref:Zona pellucida glycoprotein 1 n=1 Tax=Pipistrellus kuhlii TaxID=59472 RepID=A0A7J7X2Y5_PIPKU|nr:zona pellucida sperm-binding protein 1 [Pipistrellus kuhlii]KAF6343908.1 zona pellucida glycoprotein 1 [Pipistrellus kuhlii]
MAGALAMGWARGLALLLLLVPAATPGAPGLWHSYDCGVEGMQLLVLPPEGHTVRFKVMDEFGNQFEVNNCSSCYHWVTAKPQGQAVFSADYKGCHVLEKAGRSHLSVFIEALLPDGRVDATRNLTLVCPKPAHRPTTPDRLVPSTSSSLSTRTTPDRLVPSTSSSLSTRTTLDRLVPSTSSSLSTAHTPALRPTAEPSVDPPTPASSALGSGPTHPPHPAWAGTQGGTVETWGADEQEDTALGTRPSPEQCRGDSGRIPCVARGSSKEACQQAGCCYDNAREVPCYYGNTATVQCFRDGHFVLAVSREAALAHRVTLASIHLAYAPRCAPARETASFVVFRFPFTHCGTTVQVVGNQLIYENQLESEVDVQVGPQGAITRDGSFRLQARCVFNGSEFLPLQAAVFPLAAPSSVAQPGPLRLQLRIAKDETFGSYYEAGDYPLVRLLLEPVPVEVRLLQRADPRLALVLHRCWAAPGASPFQQPQWPLLSDGCPFEGDSYRTRLVALDGAALPFPAHYQRFTVATFAFLNASSGSALRGPVYFFCSASACAPKGLEPCSPPCGSGTARRRRAARGLGDPAAPQDVVSSPGPVGFVDSSRQEPAPGSAGAAGNSDPRLLLGVALLVAAAALVLGVGVFVGLSRAPAPGLLAGSRG